MNIDIALIPEEIPQKELEGKTLVAIDVLRATTTIITALQNGGLFIIPVLTPEEAFQKAEEFDSPLIIGGERGGLKVSGFDLGNSPREYHPEKVKGKKIILTTTNGTRVLTQVREAKRILVCALVNITAVARELVRVKDDVLIACAGIEGNFSLEDFVVAGMLVGKLTEFIPQNLKKSEAAEAAEILYRFYRPNLLGLFQRVRGGQSLIDIGLGEDLKFCAQIDLYPLVPRFKNGRIAL